MNVTIKDIESLAEDSYKQGDHEIATILYTLAGSIHMGTTPQLARLATKFSESMLELIGRQDDDN